MIDHFTLYMPEDMIKKLSEASKKADLNRSQLIRKLVKEYLEKNSSN